MYILISNFPASQIRAELHYIERAELLKRRKEIYETMFPESKAGTKGALVKHGKIDATDIMSFAEETAQKTGDSQGHIRRLIQIAESLPEDVKQTIKELDLPMGEAIELVKKQDNAHGVFAS